MQCQALQPHVAPLTLHITSHSAGRHLELPSAVSALQMHQLLAHPTAPGPALTPQLRLHRRAASRHAQRLSARLWHACVHSCILHMHEPCACAGDTSCHLRSISSESAIDNENVLADQLKSKLLGLVVSPAAASASPTVWGASKGSAYDRSREICRTAQNDGHTSTCAAAVDCALCWSAVSMLCPFSWLSPCLCSHAVAPCSHRSAA